MTPPASPEKDLQVRENMRKFMAGNSRKVVEGNVQARTFISSKLEPQSAKT